MQFFFFKDPATTEIYTLSLHDALPISRVYGTTQKLQNSLHPSMIVMYALTASRRRDAVKARSEEHTSELQSQSNLVCRLLLEKKKELQVPEPDHAHSAARALSL